MDIRFPILLIFATGLAYFTWRAQRSGEMMLKSSYLRRSEYPRLFQVGLIMRVGLVALIAIVAICMALGQFPVDSGCVAPKGIWLTYHGVPLTCPDPGGAAR